MSIRAEFRALLALAGPLALTHLGNQLLGVVDTAVVGRLGEISLGAVGLGNSVYFGVSIIGLGLMLGLDPLVSQAVGAGEPIKARRVYWQGVWLAPLLTAPLALGVLLVLGCLPAIGVDADNYRETVGYVHGRLPSLLPFLWLVGARAYLQGHNITRPLVIGVVVANVINLPLSWILVFGAEGLSDLGLPGFGIPAMGAAGAGWTSSVCTVIQCAVATLAVRSIEAPGAVDRSWDRKLARHAMGLGLPIGLTLFVEVGVFSGTGVLMATLGPRPLAAHNVALALASMSFQVTLAIGAAASVRVGQAVGRSDTAGARRAGFVAFIAGGSFMLLSSLLFVTVPHHLARLITNDVALIPSAAQLILVAAAFQLVDGLQAVGAGALRGAGDTRFALVANILGHYAIGVPLAITLTWVLGWGAVGLWWGLSAGLAVVALALTLRFARISKRAIARV